MRYAITTENNQVFQHFGKCPSFLLIDMENDRVVHRELLDAHGSGHSALVTLLKNASVDTLVCGGIGQGARDALAKVNIQLIAGAQGHVDIIVNKLTKGVLVDDPKGMCNHHHEKEEGQTCGEHTCGEGEN